MNTKKIVSAVTASTILLASLSGCSLLGGKDKTAITEVVEGYVDAVKSGKFNKTADFVLDGEDYFQEEAFDGPTQELLDAVFAVSEYEIGDIEVDKDSATCEVTFTLPDLDSIADEGYSFDEFIDAIGDIEDTVEEEFSFDLSKDGDEWFIEGDSTSDYADFLAGLVADLEFSGLSESAAIAAVETFVGYLAQGDVMSAYAMSPTDSDAFEDMEEVEEFLGEVSGFSGLFSAYFSNIDVTYEATEVTEDSITVTLTGTAPDANTSATAAVADHSIMVPIYADYLESMINGTFDMVTVINNILNVVGDAIATADPVPYTGSAVVTVDEDGNYFVDPQDDFMFDLDVLDVASSDDLMPEALDLLLSEGRITQAQYDEYAGNGSSTAPGGADASLVLVEGGDDLFDYDYYITGSEIEVDVQTWLYYDQGDVFGYEIALDGEEIMSGSYVMPDNNEDMIELIIPTNGQPSGTYDIIVFDEGATTSTVLAHLQLIIFENGAPNGNVPFGDSMTYTEVSDDVYTFHFVDGNGEWLDGEDTYASNRGAVSFVARTWGYYDEGSMMGCDIYCDGECVGSVVAVSEDDYNDTYEFEWEPNGGLSDGDYTFILYDVDADTIFLMAYATVETEN